MSQSETETKAETGGDEPETMGATLIAEALKSQVRFSLCSVVWLQEWGAQRLTGGAAGSAQGVEYVFGVVGYPIIELGTEIQKVPGM